MAQRTMNRRTLIASGLYVSGLALTENVFATGTQQGQKTQRMNSEKSTGGQQSAALRLWYTEPAHEWTDALPLGNGRLGAMVFGGMTTETVGLNEQTLWAGGPHSYDNPEGLAALPEIRRLVFAGEFTKAQALVNEKFMGLPIRQMPYQTLGDLNLHFAENTNPLSDYERDLDLTTALATTRFVQGGVRYTREAFVSVPDQVLVIHLTADHPKAISLSATFASPHTTTATGEASLLALTGISSEARGVPGQVRFTALLHASATEGSISTTDHSLNIQAATSVTLLVSLATSYKNYKDVSGDPNAIAQKYLESARTKSYVELKARHLADYQPLFKRMTFHLAGVNEPEIPTDKRIQNFSTSHDPLLVPLYFQYGRYLLLACSRPGGQPATLQGLWNNSLTPPWDSKYTVNINTEMNYWPAETCHLSECHEALFPMIAEIAETGRHTAETMYGAKRGWVCHHNTDIWRGTAPVDGAFWGMWQMGGAWLCTHIWHRYEFTGDTVFLAKYYPVIKGAVEFFLETLVKEPTQGHLVTCPAISPENAHHGDASICAGPTMDNQILHDLFTIAIETARILDVDPLFRAEATTTRGRLAPMQVGKQGQLQEWLEDWDANAPETHHRHVSHLYGLFPSRQISAKETPELFAAAKRTLEIRGDAGTGWSLAWKINFWARLLDGDRAYQLIRAALNPVFGDGQKGGGGVYRNLFDAHPPFQIDGNFGFTSGVAEMLLQSQNGELHVLPALPTRWQEGSITGLQARGGFTVDLSWKKGEQVTVTVHFRKPGSVSVRFGSTVQTLTVAGGGAQSEPSRTVRAVFPFPAGSSPDGATGS